MHNHSIERSKRNHIFWCAKNKWDSHKFSKWNSSIEFK